MKDTTIIILAIIGAVAILIITTVVCITWLSVSRGQNKTNEEIISAIVQSGKECAVETDGISAKILHGECKIAYKNIKSFTPLNIFHAIYVFLSKHSHHSEKWQPM